MVAKRPARKTTAPESNGKLPEWAVYIYMKPDQPLEEFAERDIQEMAAGVDGTGFPVAVQVDQERDFRRLFIAAGKATEIDPATWTAPDKWTGPGKWNRPAETSAGFADFLRWAGETYPAKKRLVILWGHSRGVGIDLVGPAAAAVDLSDEFDAGGRSHKASVPAPDGLRLNELLTIGTVIRGGVAKRAAPADTTTIHVLGFDSCYMSSAEFAHELSKRVLFLVAADGAVKRTGWDYRVVLGALSANPALAPQDLAGAIVEHVSGLDGNVSLARLELAKSETLRKAFAGLVVALSSVTIDPDEAHALFIMLKRTSYFQVRQFLDLRDLCHRLRAGFDGEIRKAAEAVLDAYEGMVFSRATGTALGRLNGLSIYCPLFRAQQPFGTDTPDVDAVVEEDQYEQLAFVSGTGWFALCEQLRPRLAASRL